MVKLKRKRPPKPTALPTWAEFKDLVARANSGDRLALEELGRTLDTHHEIVNNVADLSAHIERDLIARLAKGDELVKQSLEKMVAERRKELVRDPECPIQQLTAARIMVHQLEAWYLATKFPDISKVPKSVVKRVQIAKNMAERRSRSALKAMQMLHRLAPKSEKQKSAGAVKPHILKIKRPKAGNPEPNCGKGQAAKSIDERLEQDIGGEWDFD